MKMLKLFKMFKWWIMVRRLNRGNCFGEAAFEINTTQKQPNNQRRETIQALERSGMAVLSKEDYFRILKRAKDNMKTNKQ